MKASFLFLALALVAGPAVAGELEFYKDVYPFLKTNCISCHNKTTTKAKLNMETPELMVKGGDSGPAIVPGNGAESLLVKASLHADDMEMPPPNNKSGAVNLNEAQIALLRQWIDQGAKAGEMQERTVTWRPIAAGVHPIYTLAMTKDGRYAACGRSNDIYLYDLATRQFVSRIVDPASGPGAAHRALVQALAFSPDGTRLASGSFREVKIWRLEPAAPSTAPAVEAKPVDEALLKKLGVAAKTAIVSEALSSDGKLVITGCADGAVRVWEVAALKPVAELRGGVKEAKANAALEWTVQAQALEQAYQQSVVARIDAQNKALDELLKKANDAIAAMKKVLPEKQKLVGPAQAAVAKAQAAVEAAEKIPADQKKVKDAQEKLISAQTAEASALAAVSAAESNVKDAEDDVKRITDSKAKNAADLTAANNAIATAKKAQDKAAADLAASKQAIAKAVVKPVAVGFSADGLRVAAKYEGGALHAWAIASGTAVEDGGPEVALNFMLGEKPPHWVLERTLGGGDGQGVFADRVNAVTFSPDGKTLATGGGEPSRSGDIHLFEVASGKVLRTWKDRHDDAVLALDFSPDGRLLASGASDKIAKVTEVASGKQVNLFEGHTHHVMGVAFRSDGRVVATAGADGVVMTWDMLTGERKKKIEGWTKEVTSLQYIGATGQLVTSAGDNLVRIVSDEGTEVRAIARLPDFMQAAASTASGATIIGGGEDSFLRVWDGTSGKELAAFDGTVR